MMMTLEVLVCVHENEQVIDDVAELRNEERELIQKTHAAPNELLRRRLGECRTILAETERRALSS